VLQANATQDGNGGTVVVWSDDVTRYYGRSEARGGALGGNGGNVETSGKNHLDMRGRVDTGAAHGRGGNWLLDPADIEIGVAWLEHAEPLVAERVRAAADLFPHARELPLDLPDRRDWGPLFRREALESHLGLFPERADEYGEDVRESLEQALDLADGEVEAARRVRERHREQVVELTAQVDLLLTPTLPCVAPRYGEGERTTLTKFTSLFNLVGRPALALPCGPAEEGLPASVQLSAPQGEDALVLAAGAALERGLRL
jgi:Asp-tRNA(Asn)/Glu-tRNA(Gln) amidotransferase A subunit family amidase